MRPKPDSATRGPTPLMKLGKLKLTVNEEKTRICKVPEGEFDFLGYTFGRMYSAKTTPGAPAIEEEHHACG
jgi:hypothetical protein